jgi:hypothetical protein
MGLIHEINKKPKISCYCPFKPIRKKGKVEKQILMVKGFLQAASVNYGGRYIGPKTIPPPPPRK